MTKEQLELLRKYIDQRIQGLIEINEARAYGGGGSFEFGNSEGTWERLAATFSTEGKSEPPQ